MYLASSWHWDTRVVDMDVVDESNLQRQVIHNTGRVGQSKVESAKQTITALPDIQIETYDTRLNADNVLDLLASWEVVVDGADNFPSDISSNDRLDETRNPSIHGSIFRFEGQVTVFDPLKGPTYRDYVPVPPPPELAPSCAEAGVLGVLPGVIGSLQALETIKLVLQLGDSLIGRLLAFDALDMTFREYKIHAQNQSPEKSRTASTSPNTTNTAHHQSTESLHPSNRPAKAHSKLRSTLLSWQTNAWWS